MPPKIRCSALQKRMLVEYMVQHSNFANGEYNGPIGAPQYEAQWEALARVLREHGPDKSVKAWKVTWRDLRRNARVKNAEANRSHAVTGNNTEIPVVSEEDQLVLAAIGRESSEGVGPEESRIGDGILQEFKRSNDIQQKKLELMQEQNLLPNRNGTLEDTEIIEDYQYET